MKNVTNPIFLKFTKWTIFFTIFVVFAGSMVKVTGSGMGCPDWPKCFGYLIPPFTEDKITWKPNYEYLENQMIIQDGELLKAPFDFTTGTSFKRENWKLFDEHNYSLYKPMHTIIESVNRWTSVLLGIIVALMVFFSFRSNRFKTFNIIGSILALLLIGFEAWLGKLVVEGVLDPTDISYHMLAAFCIIIVLSAVHSKNNSDGLATENKLLKKLQIGAFLYLLLQLFLGVILRQTFDEFVEIKRDSWIDEAGLIFYIHRSSSLIYVLLTFISWRIIKKLPKGNFLSKNFQWIIIMTLLEIASGAIMGYLEVPKAAQPVHVIISSILLLAQSNLFFRLLWKKD